MHNSCASLAGLVLCFIAAAIILSFKFHCKFYCMFYFTCDRSLRLQFSSALYSLGSDS